MKNPISYRGSIVSNLLILEPSAVSARDYATRIKKSCTLRKLNFNKESPQMGPKMNSDFIFYLFISFIVHISLLLSTFIFLIYI